MATQVAKKQQAPPAEAQKQPPPTQALAKAPEDNTIRGLLEKAKPKLREVLPKHLSADRLVRVTIACINKTPTLLECTKESLLNAVMQAAQLGLEPTGVLGSAYLVPYNVQVRDENGKPTGKFRKEAQLIPGYRGLIDLARRSGQIESIEAHVVHANDRFQCRYGLEPALEHEPAWQGDPGPVIAAYAVAKLKDGGKQIEVMTRAQLDKIKAGTQSKGKYGPWQDHEEEMQRKTVVRRIAKYLPLTPELADALSALEDVERLDPQEVDPAPKGVEGLKSVLAAKDATLDVPHDPETGEVRDEQPAREPGADDGEPPAQTEDDPSLPEAG